MEETLLLIHAYPCQIRHAEHDLWQCRDELDLELDRLRFLKQTAAQRKWSKAYAKELKCHILSCNTFIGHCELAIKRMQQQLP
jgi:hypothetical protein